ncbi:uncharacterized protein LOC142663398 [Rhinoderma darwinii]|uniref:uncharacterized protein LOC142663398 n=1 Tax=Rhinoderma darwinii TaxID=43563 RepID=UPI003F6766A0
MSDTPQTMAGYVDEMANKILHLTLEMVYVLTGEDCIVVTKTSGEHVTPRRHSRASGGWSKTPITGEKILDLTHKIIELLTGEVPIRCQDVAVYFSMEEWKYIEEHKDIYKDLMMEDHRNRTSPGKMDLYKDVMMEDHRNRTPPGKRDLYKDLMMEDHRNRTPPGKRDLYKDVMMEDHRNRTPPGKRDLYKDLMMEDHRNRTPPGKRDLYKDVMMEDHRNSTPPDVSGKTAPTGYHDPIPQRLRSIKPNQMTGKSFLNMNEEIESTEEEDLYDFDNIHSSNIEHLRNATNNVSIDRTQLYPFIVIEDDSDSCDERRFGDTNLHLPVHHLSDSSMEESISSQEGSLTNVHILTSGFPSIHIKEESWDEGNHIYIPMGEIQYPSIQIKEELVSWEDGDHFNNDVLYTPNDLTQEYLSTHINMESVSFDELSYRSYNQFPKYHRTSIGEELFKCTECDKYFLSNSQLVLHQRSHSRQRSLSFAEKGNVVQMGKIPGSKGTFQCTECGKQFLEKGKLARHMKSHTGEKPYACSQCDKRFLENWKLMRHQKTHTGVKPYCCFECGEQFSEKIKLVNHQRIHTGENAYICSECGKHFTDRSTFLVHLRKHTAEHGKLFGYTSALSQHKMIHSREHHYLSSGRSLQLSDFPEPSETKQNELSYKVHECSECRKCFSSNSLLVIHQRSHTGEKPFRCSECGRCFAINAQLVKHLRTHTGEKPYECSECGKGLSSNAELVAHWRIHTGERPYKCSECEKCFSLKASLTEHIRTHTGEKPYLCSECGKCFAGKSTLLKHKKIHKEEKEQLCSYCGMCFVDKASLATHKRTHKILEKEVKLYICSECGKCLRHKSSLVIHQRSHTGEKPFACPECGKCFISQSKRAAHRRIHTGEKPYECSLCRKRFRLSSHLSRHNKIHKQKK